MSKAPWRVWASFPLYIPLYLLGSLGEWATKVGENLYDWAWADKQKNNPLD